jgi:hypothetical protein
VQELHAVLEPACFRDLARFHHELLVDLDAAAPRLRMHFCRLEHDPSIAGAQVVNHLAVLQTRELEHARHVFLLGRHEEREALLRVRGHGKKKAECETDEAVQPRLRAQSGSG